MRTVRKGITEVHNPDGSVSYTVSDCRAQPGHEGMYGCHHFRHCDSDKKAQKYIMLATLDKDEMSGTVNFDHDVDDLYDDFRQYLKARGRKDTDLPTNSDNNMLTSWFHNDSSEAERMLNDAQEEGVLPKLKTSEKLGDDIRNCVKSGIKVDVVADRVIGLKTDDDVTNETDIWMTANGIPTKDYDGEAPITLMVEDGKYESDAANAMRKSASPLKALHEDSVTIDPEDLESAGYASLQGRHATLVE